MDSDLNKLKVVELRAELQARGLDTKGKFSKLFGFGLSLKKNSI